MGNNDSINVTPRFVMAGNAIFTVSNGRGEHYTYKVIKPDNANKGPSDVWFVYSLAGPDNSNDFKYLGMMKYPGTIIRTAKSTYMPGTTVYKTAAWALRVIWQVAADQYTIPAGYTIRHVDKCGRCGRQLTTPESIDTGLGPECADLLGVEWKERDRRQAAFI